MKLLPFDPEKAKAGAKVVVESLADRVILPARIIAFDAKRVGRPDHIVALVMQVDPQEEAAWMFEISGDRIDTSLFALRIVAELAFRPFTFEEVIEKGLLNAWFRYHESTDWFRISHVSQSANKFFIKEEWLLSRQLPSEYSTDGKTWHKTGVEE